MLEVIYYKKGWGFHDQQEELIVSRLARLCAFLSISYSVIYPKSSRCVYLVFSPRFTYWGINVQHSVADICIFVLLDTGFKKRKTPELRVGQLHCLDCNCELCQCYEYSWYSIDHNGFATKTGSHPTKVTPGSLYLCPTISLNACSYEISFQGVSARPLSAQPSARYSASFCALVSCRLWITRSFCSLVSISLALLR